MPTTSQSCSWALAPLRAVAGAVYKVLAMPFKSCMATNQSQSVNSQEVSKSRAPSDQVARQDPSLPKPLPGNQSPPVNPQRVSRTRAPSDQVTEDGPSLPEPFPGTQSPSVHSQGVSETRAPMDQVTEQGPTLPKPLPGNQSPPVNYHEVSKTRCLSDQVTEQCPSLPKLLSGNQSPSVNSHEIFETRAPGDEVTKQSPSLPKPLSGSVIIEGVTEMEEEEILPAQKGKTVEEFVEIVDADAMFGIIKESEPFDIENVPGVFVYKIEIPYDDEALEDAVYPENSIENYLKCNGQVAESDLPPGVSENADVWQVMCDTVTERLAEQGCDMSKEAVENEWRHPEKFVEIDNLMQETQQKNYEDSGAAIIDDAMCVNRMYARNSMRKTSYSDEISCDWLVNTSEYTLEVANILTTLAEERPDLQLYWTSDCGCFVKHITRFSEQPETSELPFDQESDDELIVEDWGQTDQYLNEDWAPADQYLNEEAVGEIEEEVVDEIVFVQSEDSSVNDVRSNLLLKQPSDNEIITEESIECSDSSIQDTQLETETSAEESLEIDSDSSIQNTATATETNKSKSSPRGRTVNRSSSKQRKLNPAWDRSSKAKNTNRAASSSSAIAAKTSTTASSQKRNSNNGTAARKLDAKSLL